MPDLQTDQIVDQRYRILNRIGSGGMADVYCAEDLQLGRKVALKLLHRRFAEDSQFVERFRREASSAAGLQHPNVVGVYDRGEWDGNYYIAMEYLEGRSLKRLIQDHGPLDPALAIGITVQILRAARFAHKRGVIHRDIKPHNVIVDDEGRAKVTDFGIARAGASDMTETGSIMGTAHYLSPEQAQGHSVSAKSDLYAIGIVLYEMLAGRVPFEGESAVTIALKQVSEAPVPPSAYNQAVPHELDAIVLQALEKDPAARFADAEEFIAALERVRAALTALPAGQSTAVFAPVGPPTDPTRVAYVGEHADPEMPLVMPDGPLLDEEPEERERKIWPWIVGGLALLAVVAGILYLAGVFSPEKKTVPNVVGQQLVAASAVLQNKGFKVNAQHVTSTAPIDQVIREDPQPGSKVDKSSTITLTVSSGPGTGSVPDVSDLSQADASKQLRKHGFKVAVSRHSSDNVPKGNVIRTVPAGGQQVPLGSTVKLVVSTGPPQVSVPGVVGETQGTAESELINAGLKVAVSHQETSSQDPGTVLTESPSPGTIVSKGTSVNIVVAKAVNQATVPDVVGDPVSDAKSALQAAGFSVSERSQAVTDATQDKTVLAQSPGGGHKAKKGSTVTITVGKFTQTTTTTTTPTPTPTVPNP